VYVRAVDSGQETRLLENAGNAVVSRGHLLFVRERTLFAQPFDPDRLVLSGEPLTIAEGVLINTGSGAASFSASDNGVLVYQASPMPVSELVWFDRTRRRMQTLGEPDRYSEISLSADGSRAAASVWNNAGNRNIWLLDVRRGLRTRLTTGADDDSDPALSADGSSIAYASRSGHSKAIVVRDVTGAASPRRLVDDGFNKAPHQWSADGKAILYSTFSAASSYDLLTTPALPGGKPQPQLNSNAFEDLASGRRLARCSPTCRTSLAGGKST
jgi:hypothetical protein